MKKPRKTPEKRNRKKKVEKGKEKEKRNKRKKAVGSNKGTSTVGQKIRQPPVQILPL